MPYVMSDDILKKYCTALIQPLLMQANYVKYINIPSSSLYDILNYDTVQFLTNEKFYSYTNCKTKWNEEGFTSDKLTQFGQYLPIEFSGIVYDDSDSYLIDILNASFMHMNTDVSLSIACMQAIFLLDRIIKQDEAPMIDQPLYNGVKEYEL